MAKAKKEGKVFAILQRVGRSFMLPIALLPVAGLLLGIGASFTNDAMINAYSLNSILGEGTLLRSILFVLSGVGNIIFGNLPIIFAMGVSIGMAEREKEVACLSAVIAFFTMHQCINTMLNITGKLEPDADMLEGSIASVCGIESLQMGVFGGILVGLVVALLHNKFYKIQLPSVISFFGGTRFVPIISTLAFIPVGGLMYFAWPVIQQAINALGNLVISSGYAGTFIYGYIERALIPFGLHHVFYLPFWQTGLGGSMIINGQLVQGAQNIFFAQLADPKTTHFSVEATRFISGKFPFMIFGLPGAACAMYKTANSTKKKVSGGLILSAALTSMLTGITEPIEFTFLFVAPVLYYAVHSVLAGLSYMLMHIFNVGVGMTFSGGIIDLTLFGILQGNSKTNWIYVLFVGIAYFFIYYFLFLFFIKKFDLKTPGREKEDEETKLYTRKDYNEAKGVNAATSKASAATAVSTTSDKAVSKEDAVSAMIVDGLGGADNINDLDCCATRLRITVLDGSKVVDGLLKKSGASGVIKRGNGIQIIYGPRVTVIKSHLEEYIESIK